MTRKTTLMSVLFALVAFVANAGSGIYLRGVVNGWLNDATEEIKAQWEFQETADPNILVLTDKLLTAGEFKIADDTWSAVDFGGDGSALIPGVEYGLVEKSGNNLRLLGDATCSEIRFDKANQKLLVTLDGDDRSYKIDFADELVSDLVFTRMADAVFTLREVELNGEFCIKSLDGTVVFGSNGEDLTFGEGYALTQDGSNFNLSSVMACSSIILTETADGATLELTESGVLELYLRGDVNNWSTPDEWKFKYVGDGLYKLTDKILSEGKFKIADASWSIGSNYGGTETIVPGESFILSNKTATSEPADLVVASDIVCSQILFDIKTGTLLINFPENVYVIGDNTGWQWTDANSMLAATENEGEYSGTINLIGAGGEAVYSYWRVYDKLENQLGYSWGLAKEAETGKLLKGYDGCVITPTGWYVVTVNLKTGEVTLEPTGDPSSVADVEAADVKVIGGAGEIRVEGAAEGVKVFALSGALLSEGETIVKVPAGIYLVSVGSKVVKVAVK